VFGMGNLRSARQGTLCVPFKQSRPVGGEPSLLRANNAGDLLWPHYPPTDKKRGPGAAMREGETYMGTEHVWDVQSMKEGCEVCERHKGSQHW